jgi:hypothetical protein
MNKIIVLVFVCFYPISIWACSCIGKKTVKDEISKSDVIFSGKILSRNIVAINDSNLPSGLVLRNVEFIILITKIYKGQAINDTLRLITGVGGGDCGYEFEIGSEYIIYSLHSNKYFESGNKVDVFIYTDICTRTRRIDKKELRKIKRCLKSAVGDV